MHGYAHIHTPHTHTRARAFRTFFESCYQAQHGLSTTSPAAPTRTFGRSCLPRGAEGLASTRMPSIAVRDVIWNARTVADCMSTTATCILSRGAVPEAGEVSALSSVSKNRLGCRL